METLMKKAMAQARTNKKKVYMHFCFGKYYIKEKQQKNRKSNDTARKARVYAVSYTAQYVRKR